MSPSHLAGPHFADSSRAGILVVDDEPAIRAILTISLTRAGFQVWEAADGAEALEVYRREKNAIKLFLLDVCMPRMDGPETVTALRQLDARLCCCLMTGDPGRYSQDDLRRLGVRELCRKPLDLFRLPATLEEWIAATE